MMRQPPPKKEGLHKEISSARGGFQAHEATIHGKDPATDAEKGEKDAKKGY